MKKTKYIYILSQRYSGSTLLSFLLATHPDVSTIGERRKFYNKSVKTHEFLHHAARHCSCGELFENCPYLNAIKKRVLNQIPTTDLTTNTTEFHIFTNKYLNRLAYEMVRLARWQHWPIQPFRQKIQRLLLFNQLLAEAVLAQDDSQAFLDTSKVIDHAFYLSMIESFDFRVIWLVRDPRAQVNSAMKYNNWSATYAAQHWLKEMETNRTLLKRMNIPFLEQRYEDLCADPEAALRRIFQFSDLEEQTFSLDFRAQTRHIIGNAKMRLGSDNTIVERKEWKRELTLVQIKTIEKITAGYSHLWAD